MLPASWDQATAGDRDAQYVAQHRRRYPSGKVQQCCIAAGASTDAGPVGPNGQVACGHRLSGAAAREESRPLTALSQDGESLLAAGEFKEQ
ncbi:hypothetical protein Shyhy02_43600 [Streptomyces hygroscopicus subsp. hygroscopicus]|nr:hypothetical protein Shyhy02_43600 [Streptomyces hygroscopicus subsp. hygroscopicus]